MFFHSLLCSFSMIGVFIVFENVRNEQFKTSPLEELHLDYSGESFSMTYLSVDTSSILDLYHYVINLKLLTTYYYRHTNETTDVNVLLGMYLTKGTLKRSLKDYIEKLDKLSDIRDAIKKTINEVESVVSHLRFNMLRTDKYMITNRKKHMINKMFQSDEALIYSIGDFNKGKLNKWIFSNKKLNDYVDRFDEATYPKFDYINLILAMRNYLPLHVSDGCFLKIENNPDPIRLDEMGPCRADKICKDAALATPGFAYILTHRLIILLFRNLMKRCHVLSSPEMDEMNIDIMCAHAYRESVYIARRGFFARDLFLEQISLCGLLGYEEFHRRNWFVKAASWMDEGGCVAEDRNLIINKSRIDIEGTTDFAKIKEFKKARTKLLNNDCHNHPMALMAVTLAHGIRHALHHVTHSDIDTMVLL